MTSAIVIDRGWAWVAAFAGQLILGMVNGLFLSSGIIATETKHVFPTTTSLQLFVIFSVRDIVSGFACIFTTGVLSDHIHRRIHIMAGGVCMFLSSSFCYFARDVNYFYFYSILFGVSIALTYCQSIVQVSQYFSKYRTIAMGIVTSGTSAGTMSLPFLLDYIMEEYALRGTMLIIGALSLHVIPCGLQLRPVEFFSRHHVFDEFVVPSEDPIKDTYGTNCYERDCGVGDNENIDVTTTLHNREALSMLLLNNFEENIQVRDIQQYKKCGSDIIKVETGCLNNISEESDYGKKVKANDTTKQFLCNFIFTNKSVSRKAFNYFVFLKNPIFVSYLIGTALTNTTITCHIIMLPILSQAILGNNGDAALLLSIYSMFELVGRFFWGILGDWGIFRRFHITIFVALVLSIIINTAQLLDAFWSLAVFHATSGFFIAGPLVCMPVIFIDLFGPEVHSRSLGICNVLTGMFNFAIFTALGYIHDTTGSYAKAYHLIGAIFFVAFSIWLFITLPLSKRSTSKDGGNRIVIADDQTL